MEYLHTNTDGTTVKYTDEMIKNVIKDVQYYKDQRQGYLDRYHKARVAVYDFFNERYDSGNDEITCTVDDVNELLESIGSDKLKRLWTVSGRIEFTVTDIEADSEDDARDQVENNLSVEFDGNIVDDYNIEVNDIEQQ
jgi:hypothetical protein